MRHAVPPGQQRRKPGARIAHKSASYTDRRQSRPIWPRLQVENLEARIVLTSSEIFTAGTPANLIQAYYEHFLHRQGSAQETAGWVNVLNDGAPPVRIADAFLQSSEYRSNLILDQYYSTLGREPEQGAVDRWLGRFDRGLTDEHLVREFLASPESYALHGGSQESWLAGVYQLLLNREPDEGASAWLEAAARGASRPWIVEQIQQSPEAIANQVADAYALLLHRAPDPAGLASWSSALAAGMTRSELDASLASSVEFVSIVSGSGQTGPVSSLVVALRPDSGRGVQELCALAAAARATVEGLTPDTYRLRSTNSDLSWLEPVLLAKPFVRYAEPEHRMHLLLTPDDPKFVDGTLYGLNGTFGINAPAAWDQTTGTAAVIVAVIDTGIDYTHPDLYRNIWINQAEIPNSRLSNLTDTDSDGLITFYDLNEPVNQGQFKITDQNGDSRIDGQDILANMIKDGVGNDTGSGGWADGISQHGDLQYIDDLIGWDFINGDNDPLDDFGHGTHVAGTIGAVSNNAEGVAGINWKTQLMALKFIDFFGFGTDTDAALAINYSADHGARISNNSWGGSDAGAILTDAISYAGSQGQVFVAAAGNSAVDAEQFPLYPAAYTHPNIVSVAATNSSGALAGFSNYGAASVDLGAPGESVYSTLIPFGLFSDPSGYGFGSGTSMATPHAAGTAALLLAQDPSLTVAQIIDRLLGSASPLPALAGKSVTGGLLNAGLALTAGESRSWTGAGSDPFWSNPLNWDGGVIPAAGDTLTFGPGAISTVSVNDLAQGIGFSSLVVAGSGYDISGNPIGLSVALDGALATGANIVSVDVTLNSSAALEIGGSTSALVMTGDIDTNGFNLRVGGGNGSAEVQGVISGNGGILANMTGTLSLSGTSPNTFAGTTTLQSGTLNLAKTGGPSISGPLVAKNNPISPMVVRLGASDQIGDSVLVVLNDSAILDLDGYSDTIGSISLTNSTVVTGTGVLSLNGSLSADGSTSISGNLVLTNPNHPIYVASGSTLTVAATIQGPGGLAVTGPGTLLLLASNNFQGDLAFSAGTLALGHSQAAGLGTLRLNSGTIRADGSAIVLANPIAFGGNVTLGGSLDMTFNGPGTLTAHPYLTVSNLGATTISGPIGEFGGSRSLTKAGSGTLVLSGDSSYSGGTTLVTGILGIGHANALGTGTFTVNGGIVRAEGGAVGIANPVILGSTLTVGGNFNLTLDGPVTLTGNRTISVTTASVSLRINGSIGQSGGSRSLTKSGAGSLVLAAGNTHGGGTVLSGGSLALGAGGALGTGGFTWTAGIVRAEGGPQTVANNVTLNGGGTAGGSFDLLFQGSWTLTGNRTLTVTNTGLTTIAGVIGQSGGSRSLTKAGAGTLVLAAANTFSGGFILNAGTLALGHNNGAGTGTLTLKAAKLQADGNPVAIGNAVSLAGNATIAGSLDVTFSGAVTLTGDRTLAVTNTGLTTISGSIGQSSGSRILTKSGPGTLLVSAVSTLGGGLTLSAGTLALAASAPAGSGTLKLSAGTIRAEGGPLTVVNNVTLAGNATFGGTFDLTFTGNATLTGTRTLTTTNSAITTFAGTIGQSAANFGLTKAGSGTLALSANNSYSGTTTVNAGLLLVNGTITGAVAVNNSGTLAGAGSVGAVTLNAGGTILPGNAPGAAGILATGNLVLKSSSTALFDIAGLNPGSEYDQLNVAGAVNLGSSALSLVIGPTFTPSIGDSFILITNDGADAVVGTFLGLAEGAVFPVGGFTFQITYLGDTGNDVVVSRIS